ncbi:hypothetical protein ACFV29_40200 [Streptomyces sp. NPDC059690]|uniref:hypothetical protein n=1 Tax=Streptomyces sp. NPDC059690 TaxID=3346907 RepID=UPI0036B7DADA
MKTTPCLEIQRYLGAVDRAAVLPYTRRIELLACIEERIYAALDERPGDVDAVLDGLSDPRAVAVTALSEDTAALDAVRHAATHGWSSSCGGSVPPSESCCTCRAPTP